MLVAYGVVVTGKHIARFSYKFDYRMQEGRVFKSRLALRAVKLVITHRWTPIPVFCRLIEPKHDLGFGSLSTIFGATALWPFLAAIVSPFRSLSTLRAAVLSICPTSALRFAHRSSPSSSIAALRICTLNKA
jgi:hypothetical protein